MKTALITGITGYSVWRTIAPTFRLSESRVNLLTLPSMRKVNIVNYLRICLCAYYKSEKANR